MIIDENWFCCGANFDDEKPYITVYNNEDNSEEKIPIPEQLAYYLRTHWCGSEIMHKRIVKSTKETIREELKNILGLKNE